MPYFWEHFNVETLIVPKLKKTLSNAPVVQTMDSAIHRINLYPLDAAICFPNTYPLDSDLSGPSCSKGG